MNRNSQIFKIIYYILPVGKGSDVQKSHFQLAKIQKIKNKKTHKNKNRTLVP